MIKNIPKNIKSFHIFENNVHDNISELDMLVDELSDQLDWYFTIDYQIIEKNGSHSLYSISILAGSNTQLETPVFMSTALLIELIVRLKILLNVLKKI